MASKVARLPIYIGKFIGEATISSQMSHPLAILYKKERGTKKKILYKYMRYIK